MSTKEIQIQGFVSLARFYPEVSLRYVLKLIKSFISFIKRNKLYLFDTIFYILKDFLKTNHTFNMNCKKFGTGLEWITPNHYVGVV